MSKAKPWFRLYSEMKNDRKIRRLTPEERWLWVALLCIASESPVRGHLLITENMPYEIHDLADEACMDPQVVEETLPKFEAMGMLHREDNAWVVTNFTGRQYEKKSDRPENTRARKQVQREREKAAGAVTRPAACRTTAAAAGAEKTGASLENPAGIKLATCHNYVANAGTTEKQNSVNNQKSHTNVTPLSRRSHAPDTETDITDTETNNMSVVSSSNTRAREIQASLQAAGILMPSPLGNRETGLLDRAGHGNGYRKAGHRKGRPGRQAEG